MLLVCSLLVFALLTTHLSPATVGVASAAAIASGTSCLDCPLEDGDSSRGKLSFNPIIPVDEDYLKTIGLASSPTLLGGGRGGGGTLSPQEQQQKARLYHLAKLQQHHQKILAQQQRIVPSSSSAAAAAISAPPVVPLPTSNLLHVYTLLNKGSAQEPRLIMDEYYLQDPGIPLSSQRIAKKAERGMLVDVLDYVSKPDDRNRRVGQNMRTSG